MPQIGPDRASCFVFSFKEGLLSKLAHDLKFRIDDFTITTNDEGLPTEARFDVRSLALVCQMLDGKEHGEVSASDREKILENALTDVLDAKHHPEALFVVQSARAEGEGHRVAGKLTLRGKTRELELVSRREGDREVAEVRLHQPDFGIKPFSAMLGALKVRPDVLVRIELR